MNSPRSKRGDENFVDETVGTLLWIFCSLAWIAARVAAGDDFGAEVGRDGGVEGGDGTLDSPAADDEFDADAFCFRPGVCERVESKPCLPRAD